MWLQNRIDTAFVSIYATNLSIIHGASLYTLVYQSFSSLLYIPPSKQMSRYYDQFYADHTELICDVLVVLGIIFWVSVEYYWFMTLVRKRPSPRDTIAQLLIGVCEIAAAFVVITPRYLIWVVAFTGFIGAIGYGNSYINVQQANIPKPLRKKIVTTLYRDAAALAATIVTVIAILYIAAFPYSKPEPPSSPIIHGAVLSLMLTILIACGVVSYLGNNLVKWAQQNYAP